MRQEYTREEKAAYFKRLREAWARTKTLAEQAPIKAAFYEAQKCSEKGFSCRGFAYVYMQMKEQGLSGLPYIDAKTFKGWQEAGFRVRKGVQSTLSGITWIRVGQHAVEGVEGATDDEGGFLMPKVYVLFHKSQVEGYNGARKPVEHKAPEIVVRNPQGETVAMIPIEAVPVSEVKKAADAIAAIPAEIKQVAVDALRSAFFA